MNTIKGPALADLDLTYCRTCCEIFTEPKIIPCGHVICRSCVLEWLNQRSVEPRCPLCRYDLLEEGHLAYRGTMPAEDVADAMPTDLVVKAIARGRHDVTLDTCLGCDDLLCLSRATPHPLCPGQQDSQTTTRREAEVRATLTTLSEKVRVMEDRMTITQIFLDDRKMEFLGMVATYDIIALRITKAVQLVMKFQIQIKAIHLVLNTHQKILKRLQDSRQVLAIILMEEPMQRRIKSLERRIESFHGIVFHMLLNEKKKLGFSCSRRL